MIKCSVLETEHFFNKSHQNKNTLSHFHGREYFWQEWRDFPRCGSGHGRLLVSTGHQFTTDLSNPTKIKIPSPISRKRVFLAGVAGFEPTSDGVKVRCLTAWLHPYLYHNILPISCVFVNTKMFYFLKSYVK